jgi:hypothetical protein
MCGFPPPGHAGSGVAWSFSATSRHPRLFFLPSGDTGIASEACFTGETDTKCHLRKLFLFNPNSLLNNEFHGFFCPDQRA